MSHQLAISKYVAIRHGNLSVNGKVMLSGDGSLGIKEQLRSWYTQLGIEYPKFFKMDLLCQLAFIGSEVLLNDTALLEKYPRECVAIILSNSAASLDTDRKYQETIAHADAYFPSPSVFVYTLPSIMCGEIAIRNGIQGENNLLVTNMFEPETLFEQIFLLFNQTETQACIGGWVQLDGSEYELLLFLVLPSLLSENHQFTVENVKGIYSKND